MNELNENLLSFEKAKEIMFNSISKNKVEIIDIEMCVDRILAENIFSKINIPEFSNSAVDGFGFISSKKKIRKLKIVGESKPGKPFLGKINKEQAIKVFTGAYVIKRITNVDTVCMEENVEEKENEIMIRNNFKKGSNIRIIGEDVKKNKKIFDVGRRIRSVDLSQLSSLGLKKIKVYKKLKVGIFSSGDELCEITHKKKRYQIFDSNKFSLLSLFKKIGCEVIDLGIIRDNFIETERKISKKIDFLDLIVTSGGVSKSKTDMIGKFLKKKGKILFWRLSIKPGRPFAFGKLKNVPFIGLPGNPVAAVITFFMLVINYVNRLSGLTDIPIVERLLPCDFDLKKKKGRTEWLRGKITKKNQSYFITRFPSTGSGIISSLSQSQGIIELEKNSSFIKKGTLLKFYRYEDMLN